ncbi:MAG TPA: lipopolysaccharide assembly protein LapB [Gammaproteobacteria bacterium]|nr:lipopolysaccharide assembly protein LapB [Gammaproteobacteria bacterium]
MQELLWLLLPVAAFSGWWAARRSERRRRDCLHPELSSGYFQGLNYLLNEQPDKAIEVFIRMLEVNSETVETHLALGNLFRRRGEVDRAIHIHQNLIARPTLSARQRSHALLELGQDYMRAGLLDRAENLFGELVEDPDHSHAALQQLLVIYQQEKDWDKAIQTARRLATTNGRDLNPMIAQFYCERAEEAMGHGDEAEARQMLKRALAQDRDCVRASLLQGELAREAGDCKAAIRAYRRVENQDIDFLPEVIRPLGECYQSLGKADDLQHWLETVLHQYGGVSPVLALADLIVKTRGEAAGIEFITEQQRRRPSLRGLSRLISMNLSGVEEGPARDNLLILKGLTDRLLTDKPVYRCHACGFNGKTLHWQCPGCKEWNTVKPIYGVEGE